MQKEFADLFEFEVASDAQELQWRQNGTWADASGVYRSQPKGLALRDLHDFDVKGHTRLRAKEH